MGRLLYICVIFLSVSFVSAQKAATDSLLLQLNNHHEKDTSRINLLNKIAFSFITSDSTKAMEYADKAESLSNELKYHKGKAYSYFVRAKNLSRKSSDTSAIAQFLRAVQIAEIGGENSDAANYLGHLGAFYVNTGNTEEAKECYEKGIKLCIATNDKRKLSRLLISLGIVYSEHGEFLKALDCNDQALKISISLNDPEVQSSALNNTGSIFYDLGNYPKAQDYYFQSLKIKEKIGDKKRLINSYLNIGNIILLQGNGESAFEYMNKALAIAEEIKDKRYIGQCYEEIGKLQQSSDKQAALANYEKALSYANELALSKSVISNLINIGDVNIEMSHYDEAWINYSKAQTLANSIGRKQDLGRIWRKIGWMHYHKNELDDAIANTSKSLKIATELNLTTEIKDVYEQLYKIYEKKGDYEKSFFYLKNFKQLNDSIFNEKNLRKTTEQEYIYQFDTEKQLMERQNQEKEAIAKAKEKLNSIIIAILAIGICLVSLLSIFLYRSYRQKHHFNNLLEKQKEEIEEKNSQLKEFNEGKDKFFSILAHDLKSSFNSILGFSDLLSSTSTTYTTDEIQKMSLAIHTSAQNTYKLLENLLTWSKANVGVVGFKPVQFNMDELIDASKPEWTSMAAQKNIEIVCNHLNTNSIFADREMIKTILRNLVTNAIKFTPEGGHVEITTNVSDEGAHIAVADTGIGLTKEEIDDLFIVGKISTRLGTKNEMGTGLGLLICKEFVTRHNGQIWVESEPEKGSRFMFFIPKPE